MDERDFFAGAALHALIFFHQPFGQTGQKLTIEHPTSPHMEIIAKLAYEYADAMLKQRPYHPK